MTTTPLAEQAFKCFGISQQCDLVFSRPKECRWLPSQNALAAAAFLTPRLHEVRDLHSGREWDASSPFLDHQLLLTTER